MLVWYKFVVESPMKLYRYVTLFFFLLAPVVIFSQEYSFTPDIRKISEKELFQMGGGTELGLSDQFFSREFVDFGYNSKYFAFVAATSFHQDHTYTPDPASTPNGTLLNSYFLMDQGGMIFRNRQMTFEVGRLEHHDVIDSPYALFISSQRNPAFLANFRYENNFAFYETRWIDLNERSAVTTAAFPSGFPDRGAQLKTYGIKINTMRFGFQDAAVYVGRWFDLEYFASPLPNYLIQYVKGTDGRPWSTGTDENDIMGFFWDWKATSDLYLDAQLFIDDIGILGAFNTPNNPWKVAYSLGFKIKTDIGNFGFHHALATQYTFSMTNDQVNTAYSWSYYPDTRYDSGAGVYRSMNLEDLMVGYYNGENNIAFRVDYDGRWFGLNFVSDLEFVLSGPKSPDNAWDEYLHYPSPGTKLLDYSVLEKKFLFNLQVSKVLGNFVVFSNAKLGVAFNALQLQSPGVSTGNTINDNVYLWRPGDTTAYTYAISVGFRYNVPVMDYLKE